MAEPALHPPSSPFAAPDLPREITQRLAPLFFVSGAAALIYQVCWQRLLFTALGVDMESVTLIVSVFMLGLGLGALLGGQLADRFPGRALGLFAAAELGIIVRRGHGASIDHLEESTFSSLQFMFRRRP